MNLAIHALPIATLALLIAELPAAETVPLAEIRRQTLAYADALQVPGRPIGYYLDHPGSTSAPSLYASCDVAHMRTVMGEDLQTTLTPTQRRAWIDHINSFARSDGTYGPGRKNHSAQHANGMVVGALGVLGGKQRYRVRLYDDFDALEEGGPWLEKVDWHKQWGGSHLFWGGMHCFSLSRRCTDQWRETVFDWLDANLDPQTGWWRKGVPHAGPFEPLGGGAHIWPIYQHHGHRFPYPERVIDSILALQKPDGSWLGYGNYMELDALYGLAYMSSLAPDHRRADILDAARRHGRGLVAQWPGFLARKPDLHVVLGAVGVFGLLQQLLPETFVDDARWTDIFSDSRLYQTHRVEVQGESVPYGRIPDDLPLDAVKWTGGFWQDRMRRLRDIYLPGVLDGAFMTVENGATFRNFLRAAGLEEGGALGRTWSDGDCYLVLDTVSRLYAYHPDEYLKGRLDDWIPIIGRIQREDGLVDTWTVLKRFDAKDGKAWERYEKQQRQAGFQGLIAYNTGHLHAAARTHQRATGDDRFLVIADKAVLSYMSRGVNNSDGFLGWASRSLHARTGEQRHLEWLQRTYARGWSPFGPPLREAVEVYGHNTVTAHYLTGATALYDRTGEQTLLDALARLATNTLAQKTYITGAVAPVFQGQRPEQVVNGKKHAAENIHEAVGRAYDLPNDGAYCESCGQCLYMEWYYRMFRLTGQAVYMDAAERALYNAVPGCVDLDRSNFFYCNPQEQMSGSKRFHTNGIGEPWESNYTWKRQYTKNCACCPPKVMRAIAMSAEVAYNANREGLWVNLYGDNTARVALPAGGMVQCRQTSAYPWDGKVRLVLEKVDSANPFDLFLRIPGWAHGAVRIAVNEDPIAEKVETGTYCRIQRQWKSGDIVDIELPMEVRFMGAHPNVTDARGKVAVMRGPVVYCLEGDDVPDGVAFEHVRVPATAELTPVFSDELGGVMKLTGPMVCAASAVASADRLTYDETEMLLYREARFAKRDVTLMEGDHYVTVSMIPYYARLNRKSDHFKIWLPVY